MLAKDAWSLKPSSPNILGSFEDRDYFLQNQSFASEKETVHGSYQKKNTWNHIQCTETSLHKTGTGFHDKEP